MEKFIYIKKQDILIRLFNVYVHFRYAQEVVAIVRPFALTTISFSTFELIIIGLIFITVSIRIYY